MMSSMRRLFFSLALLAVFIPQVSYASSANIRGTIIEGFTSYLQSCNAPDAASKSSCLYGQVEAGTDSCIGANTGNPETIANCVTATLSAHSEAFGACGITAAQEACFWNGGEVQTTDTTQATPQTTTATQSTTGTQTTNTTQTQTTSAGASTNSGPTAPEFRALTSIPGIQEAAQAPTMTAFLNSLYKICIGIAVILALLQIVRGGITYMMSDTGVYEKRQARHHIELAVLGLVLVLSPALVFGVIDPDILKLSVDVSPITPPGSTTTNPPANAPNDGTSCTTISPGSTITEAQLSCCADLQVEGQTCGAQAFGGGKYTCTCH